jgi:hypothetical protein
MKTRAALPAILCLTLLPGCSSQESTTRPSGIDHSALDRILRDNVRDQRVDYLNIRRRHWRRLNDYVETLAKARLEQGAAQERLAALINLYNATMIKAVIERLHVAYSPAENKFSVFDEKLVRTRDGKISLNHLENEIIRKQFKDPRIHVALVCGAVSCPPLLPRAYAAGDLNKVLEDGMRSFANDTNRNRIDTKKQELHLSQIFKWYAQDFGGKDGLKGYLNKYLKRDLSRFQISFQEYSWKLNLARPNRGRWVQTLGDRTVLRKDRDGEPLQKRVRKGSIFEILLEDGGFLQVDDPLGGGKVWVDKLAVAPY